MIAAAHQPNYLPWPGFFHKMVAADVFIYVDDAQFARRSVTHRTRIKTAQGAHLLSLAVRAYRYDPIDRVLLVAPCETLRRHWLTLCHAYGRSRWFAHYASVLEPIFRSAPARLLDLNLPLLEALRQCLDIATPTVTASTLGVTSTGTQRLLDLCRKVGASVYLSGPGGRAYLNQGLMERAGVEVRWQQYRVPPYPQLHGPFLPGLSTVDALLCCGPDARRHLEL